MAATRAYKRGDRRRLGLRAPDTQPACGDTCDPGFRRLHYIRYADDHLLGFTGPQAEAEEIKARLAEFLRDDLKLELSPEKTLITHGRTGAARFLGYEITAEHDGSHQVDGVIALRVPRDVIKRSAPHTRGSVNPNGAWS